MVLSACACASAASRDSVMSRLTSGIASGNSRHASHAQASATIA